MKLPASVTTIYQSNIMACTDTTSIRMILLAYDCEDNAQNVCVCKLMITVGGRGEHKTIALGKLLEMAKYLHRQCAGISSHGYCNSHTYH